MEAWRISWRATMSLISTAALRELEQALVTDDVRLIQGATTIPPPFQCVQYWPCEAACLVGFCGVVECGGFGVATVGEAEEYFARVAFETDRILGEPAGVRHHLNHYDDSPRDQARLDFLEEVRRALDERDDVDEPIIRIAE